MARKVLICLQRGAFQVLVRRIMHSCCFSFSYRLFIVTYEFIQCPQYTSWVSRWHSYSFSFETKIRAQDSLVVVCNLDGKIDRTTVWDNGAQNSGLVNCLGISFAICTNQFHLSKKTTARAWNWWLCRNGTRISVCNIPSRKTGKPFQMFL